MLQIEAIAAFTDNYIWLLSHPDTTDVAVVDPGCAESVMRRLQAGHHTLTDIVITHHHPDHTGGISALKAYYPKVRVWGPKTIAACDYGVAARDTVMVLEHAFTVLATPGHTLDHLCYWNQIDAQLFTGDTLFAGGCGRVFEGTHAQMLASLEQLINLPEQTQCYCAHEYTLSNVTFALQVEPNNAELVERWQQVKRLRAKQAITVPFTVAQECATNPFVRCDQKAVIAAVSDYAGELLTDKVPVFTQLRGWKNTA